MFFRLRAECITINACNPRLPYSLFNLLTDRPLPFGLLLDVDYSTSTSFCCQHLRTSFCALGRTCTPNIRFTRPAFCYLNYESLLYRLSDCQALFYECVRRGSLRRRVRILRFLPLRQKVDWSTPLGRFQIPFLPNGQTALHTGDTGLCSLRKAYSFVRSANCVGCLAIFSAFL